MLQVRWKSLWHVHNFLTNQLIKEFWKSVHICQSYYQSQTSIVAYFFETVYIFILFDVLKMAATAKKILSDFFVLRNVC